MNQPVIRFLQWALKHFNFSCSSVYCYASQIGQLRSVYCYCRQHSNTTFATLHHIMVIQVWGLWMPRQQRAQLHSCHMHTKTNDVDRTDTATMCLARQARYSWFHSTCTYIGTQVHRPEWPTQINHKAVLNWSLNAYETAVLLTDQLNTTTTCPSSCVSNIWST